MKFALVDGIKTEATKGAKGICPSCGAELIAKCGEVNINHWAHKGNINCDRWWEPETEWHRSWKGHFPIEWQEVVHKDITGEKHIADVKTAENWILEFQHSFIKPEEMRSRNTFYKKIVWVVDGLKRKNDHSRFLKVINEGSNIQVGKLSLKIVEFPEESRILKEWLNYDVPVFFDFQETTETKLSMLWLLIPNVSIGEAYLIPYPTDKLVEFHTNKGFDSVFNNIIIIREELIRILKNNRSRREANYVVYFPNRRQTRRPL